VILDTSTIADGEKSGMTTVNTTVQSGICGFVADIEAHGDEDQNVSLGITTECPNILALARLLLVPLNAYSEIWSGYDGAIWRATRTCKPKVCIGCIVPSGIFKSMQVAAGLALPADWGIQIKA
jgi:hypothetical protein